MPRRTFAALVAMAAIAATAAACIDVPDSMRAQFAAPGPGERTNYRPGNHGTMLPRVEVSADASAPAAVPVDLDAGPAASVEGGAV